MAEIWVGFRQATAGQQRRKRHSHTTHTHTLPEALGELPYTTGTSTGAPNDSTLLDESVDVVA